MYKYSKVRIVCKGIIKSCDHCKDIHSEGYCKMCGRKLWKKENEPCNSIVGYVDGEKFKQGRMGIDFKCRDCNSVTTI